MSFATAEYLLNRLKKGNLLPAACELILCDLSEASFTNTIGEYVKLIDSSNQIAESLMKYKIAFLVDTPKETAYLMIFKSKVKDAAIKVFSTKEKSQEWLKDE